MNTLKLIASVKNETHYQHFVEIDYLVYPDYPSNIDDWQRDDATREEKYAYHRYLLVQANTGKIVGYASWGHTFWAYHPDKYFLEIFVRPSEWGKGYGKETYNRLLADILTLNPISIETESRENLDRGMRFVKDRGFERKLVEYSSKLDLALFDAQKYSGLIASLENDGYRFVNLAQFSKENPNYLKLVYEAGCEIEKDIPWHAEKTQEPFERFKKRFKLAAKKRIDECYILAIKDDDIVGLTMLFRAEDAPTTLYTGMSGIKRPHRRKGLVTALKSISLGWAKRYLVTPNGLVPSVFTENEENNPMYLINEKMGFIRQPSFYFFVKTFREENNKQKNEKK